MPFTYEINGQEVEFDREPTEADIDEAASQLGGQQQTAFTQAQFPEAPQAGGDLGLNVLGKAALRGKLAFGDKPEQVQSFLEQRYPDRKITRIKDRKFAIDGVPIDPEGLSISDLPFDIIDVSDEIVRLGGQLFGAAKGAVIGAPGGPAGVGVGAIVGGATGRGAGQALVETVGRAFGVQGGEGIGEVAIDIARESAIGATGEALGLGLRGISKVSGKFLRTFWKNIARKGRIAEQTVINFTSGAEKESIKFLQKVGPKALSDANLSDDALLRIGQKIQAAATKASTRLGQAVRTGKGIIRGIDKKTIDLTDIRADFASKLQGAGLIGRNLRPIRPEIGRLDVGQKDLIKIFDVLRKSRKISPAKALQWREQLDRVITFNRTGKITLTGGEDAIAKGLRSQLKQKLIEVSDDFAKANKDFTEFAAIAETLKGKLDDKSVENFLKTTFSGQHIFEESLKKLNRVVGPEDTFMQPLRAILAARSFAKTTFAGIRTGIFAGLLGGLGLAGGGGLVGALAPVTAGVILSTPKIAGKAILKRQAAFRTLQAVLQKVSQRGQQVTPKAAASILNRLLQKK